MNQIDEHPIADRVRSELPQIAESAPAGNDMWLRIMDASNATPSRALQRRWRLVAVGATCAAAIALFAVVAAAGTDAGPKRSALRSADAPDPAVTTNCAPTSSTVGEGAPESTLAGEAAACASSTTIADPPSTSVDPVDPNTTLPVIAPQPAPAPDPGPGPVTTIVPDPMPTSPYQVNNIRESVVAAVGETVVVKLDSKNDGGFRWEIDGAADGAVATVAAEYDQSTDWTSLPTGVPIPFLVQITGVAPGTTTVHLIERRPFAPSEVTATAEVTITVR
ncbi:MAG: protease inhibitor I42 family protein [Acidimicrobiia bacterium]